MFYLGIELGSGTGHYFEAQARSRPALAWPGPRLGRSWARIGHPFYPESFFVPDSVFYPGEENGFILTRRAA